jgi:uncharacterized protein YeaO (DUF488 family)
MLENNTEAKVYQLCKELNEMKKRKKEFVQAYNEEIRRMNDEIKDLLNPSEKIEVCLYYLFIY